MFYNDEQALRSLIHLAYIAAVDDYVQIQELPTGKGCADVVFIPRRGSERAAMIVELKYDGGVEGAIAQIKERNYPQLVADMCDRLLLVGVNYNRRSKKHECSIEEWEKTQGAIAENSRSSRENSRSRKVEKIVAYCSEPRSLEEIAAHLGVSDKYFMKHMYIDPVLGTRLRMTEPDSPTSPTQKYVAVE